MDNNTAKQAGEILNQAMSLYRNKVKSAQANPVDEIRTITIDLSIAKSRQEPLKISFPFKSVYVEEASDPDAFIRLIPETMNDGTSDTKLSLRDAFNTEFGFSSCYLFWPAQNGKKMILKFYTTSNISNGQLVLNTNVNHANLRVGNASADLDGFTIVQTANLGTTAVTQFPWVTSHLNIVGYNDGAFRIIGIWPGLVSVFKCPTGYTAEIVGAVGDVSAIHASGMQINFYAVPNLMVYASNAAFQSSARAIGQVGNMFGQVLGVKNLAIRADDNNYLRTTSLDENECLVVTTYSAGSTASAIVELLIRLKQKVGA